MNGTGAVIMGGLFALLNLLLAIVLNNLYREVKELRKSRHKHNNFFLVVDDRLRALERQCGLTERTILEDKEML